MRGRRFSAANMVFSLPGGTEDNDLWVEVGVDDEWGQFIRSVWVPSDEERQMIAEGANISLTVLGAGLPPIAMSVTEEQPGR